MRMLGGNGRRGGDVGAHGVVRRWFVHRQEGHRPRPRRPRSQDPRRPDGNGPPAQLQKARRDGLAAAPRHHHAGTEPGGVVELHHRDDARRPRHRRLHRPRSLQLHPGLLDLREHRARHDDLGRRRPPADQGRRAGQQPPGQALLVLPHRARHPGLDLQDPDQLPGRGDRHQGDRRHGHARSGRLLRGLLLLHLRPVRGLPEPRGRRDPVRRRQQERRPLEPAGAGQLAQDPQGHQHRPLRQHRQDPVRRSTSTRRPTAPGSTSRARASSSNAASTPPGSPSPSISCRSSARCRASPASS